MSFLRRKFVGLNNYSFLGISILFYPLKKLSNNNLCTFYLFLFFCYVIYQQKKFSNIVIDNFYNISKYNEMRSVICTPWITNYYYTLEYEYVIGEIVHTTRVTKIRKSIPAQCDSSMWSQCFVSCPTVYMCLTVFTQSNVVRS